MIDRNFVERWSLDPIENLEDSLQDNELEALLDENGRDCAGSGAIEHARG